MRRAIAILTLAAAAAACETPDRPASAASPPRGSAAAAADQAAEFAVPCVAGDSLFITPVLAERRHWYGEVFRDLGQARFCPLSPGVDEAYRFTRLPSFTPAIGVTLERRGTAWTLTSRVAAQPYRVPCENCPDTVPAPGPPRVRTRPLRPDEAAALEAALRRARFWSMQPNRTSAGFDGVEWVMEGARAGRYHAVDRWSPDQQHDAAYLALGRLIVRLAGVASPEIGAGLPRP